MAAAPFAAAGATDTGLRREVNEDRFHCDTSRGLFLVIDGVGGHAAGGKAADVALAMLRARLERETGTRDGRLREAIAIANGEIHTLAASRPEWKGMACVLTAAIVHEDRVTIGHVGDTRLYKLRCDRIDKITRDHSPVGEREDANEISEAEAMRHPRRNEVYRDVGSEPHEADDPEFVDVVETAFEPDAALLLCSDGLTDLVPATTISRLVHESAGDPPGVVRALIAAANGAGGKDNVTAVYVEGPQFARAVRPRSGKRRAALTTVVAATTAVLSALVTVAFLKPGVLPLIVVPQALPIDILDTTQSVPPSGSIADAIARARQGTQVVVEPGEYHEQLRLRTGVRVVSRVPRGATLRLPVTSTEVDPAVIASGVTDAEFAGFRIVGDAASPLGVGVFATDAQVSIHDVEITGASRVAVDLSSGARASLVGSDIHDNAGSGLWIRAGATPRVAHSTFARNGTLPAISSVSVEPGAEPVFYRNVFVGMAPDAFDSLGAHFGDFSQDNWFLDRPRPTPTSSSGARRRP